MDITEEQLERLDDALRVAVFDTDPDKDNEQLAALAEAVLGAFDYDSLRAELAQTQSDRQREHDLRVRIAGEVEALRADAERYRWLRRDRSHDAARIVDQNVGKFLDETIDAVMAASSGEGEE